MTKTKKLFRVVLLCAAIAGLSIAFIQCGSFNPVAAVRSMQTDPWGLYTWQANAQRTGLNSAETVLTPTTVASANFKKLASLPVDGSLYAQILVAPQVIIPSTGTTHDLVIAATEHDSVYAFDAKSLSTTPLWKVSFINAGAGITTVPSNDDGGCTDLVPEIGITGTPVIDPSTSTLYVVAATKENGSYLIRLHALDLATGAEKFNGPVNITASVQGTGDGASGGMVTFNALMANQRSALLLANGTVYIAFASHCDIGPYHGWLFGYNSTTLAQEYVLNVNPNGSDSGIWMGGSGPAADTNGNIFFMTGNGTFDANMAGGKDYGDSIVKVSPTLSVLDYFTPFDQANLNTNDLDLGSGGVALIPDQTGAHPHILAGSGKTGTIYVVDRDNLGKYNGANDNQIVQSLTSAITGGIYGAPATWNNFIYFAGNGDALKQFSITGGLLSTSPTHQAPNVTYGFPGCTPFISSNGTGNAIVWTLEQNNNAILRAYNATDVSQLIYDSSAASVTTGASVKFTNPVVLNGQVYFGTQSSVIVFGLQ